MKQTKDKKQPDKSMLSEDSSLLELPLKRKSPWQKKSIFTLSFGFLILLLVGITVLGLWSWYGSIEESILGMGQLVPEGKLRRVMSPANGIVAKVYIKENQEIKAGQVLAELDPEPTLIEQKGLDEQIAMMEAEASALRAASSGEALFISNSTQSAWLAASRQAYESQKAEAEMRISEARYRYQEAIERLKQAETVLSTSEELFKKYKALYEEGGLPAKDVEEYKQKVNSQQGEVAALKEAVQAARVALAEAEQRPHQIYGNYQSQILAQLSDREQRLSQFKSEAEKVVLNMKRQTILSPVDGVVNEQIIRGAGDVVAAGEPLLSIVPVGSSLVAEVKVANQDLSYVHPGQRAALRLDALPYQQFGRLYGTVEAISPSTQQSAGGTAIAGGEISTTSSRNVMPYYVITIRPDKLAMSYNGKNYPMRSGMTLSADIITREKNILSFFMEPIHVYFNRAFSDPTIR